ncbi:MAG TPA: AfsR/SARP family transcriptional regulator [Pseudonocardiaceae bacterium]|nr:AfsR/SARP family transcriptional regulator [Pseudonocardiaceae bacterium]
MKFAILGSLVVRVDQRHIELSSAKERLVLAALLVNAGDVVSTDRLIEVLWGGQPPETAANTVQTYISRLRRVLEPGRPARAKGGVLCTHGHGYRLALAPEAIDSVRFERLARQGREALPGDPELAAETLRRGLALWRGEPLADFSFEPFAQAEITRLSELRIAALEDRVEADLALGRHAALCGELSQAVHEQPLRERLWSQLIRALYRSGRQADALAAYARLREQLTEQLGIDPSPELVRLHEALLNQHGELEYRPPERQLIRPVIPLPTPSPAVPEPVPGQLLPAAHAALGAHDWQRALTLFAAADQAGPLAAEDLEGLADAAMWVGNYRESLAARQRAHQAFLQAGDHRRAAQAAIMLTLQHGGLQQISVASGWFQRAQRLLEDEPDCAAHGYLSWAATLMTLSCGDHEACLEAARSTYDTGLRHGAPELQAIGLVYQGTVLIHRGEVKEGLALLDEGMAMAVGGDLPPVPTALIFCRTIHTCDELGDYRRAEEWSRAIEDCFTRTGLTSFPGDCETHRVGIMVGRGAWVLAEQVARRACACMECFDLLHVGLAFASIGEIRLRIGDLSGAENAFTKAEELGASVMPGRARLLMLQGRPVAAAALINSALAGEPWDRLGRARLLPDQVTIALAVGDLDTARAAAAELAQAAQLYGSKALLAATECARGELALATGEDDPVPLLRRSVALWAQAWAPYEGARVRVLLARALDLSGNADAARHEYATAQAGFERLGAWLDAKAAADPSTGPVISHS